MIRGMIRGMFQRHASGYDSPDASKHGFKTMGMIRGYDSGHDSGCMIRGKATCTWS